MSMNKQGEAHGLKQGAFRTQVGGNRCNFPKHPNAEGFADLEGILKKSVGRRS